VSGYFYTAEKCIVFGLVRLLYLEAFVAVGAGYFMETLLKISGMLESFDYMFGEDE
jgi:hypothetical protein